MCNHFVCYMFHAKIMLNNEQEQETVFCCIEETNSVENLFPVEMEIE